VLAGLCEEGIGPTGHRRGVHRLVADLRTGRARGDDLARERDRSGNQVALHELRAVAELEGFFGLDRRAADDHVERLGRTDHARQPLGAAGTRQQAEVHLGQADQGAGRADPVVAAERELVAAAERQARDSGDDRLVRAFDQRDQLGEIGRGARLRRVELADVGAAGEGARGAGQHHGLDRGVGQRAADPGVDAGAQVEPEAVDRGVLHRDDGDLAILAVAGLGHG
jgi:hypothetical protein